MKLGINYMLIVVLLLQLAAGAAIGIFFQGSVSQYVQIFITQVFPILLPALLYCLFSEKGFQGVARSGKFTIGKVISCITLAISVNILVNLVTQFIVMPLFSWAFTETGAGAALTLSTAPATATEYVLDILFICLMPAVFEEILFRGVTLTRYEALYGSKKAIFMCAIVFAVMHNSLPALVPQFMIGIFLSYIVIKYDSIYMGMIAHFTHNLTTLILQTIGKWQSDTLDAFLFGNPLAVVLLAVLLLIASILFIHHAGRDVTFQKASVSRAERRREKLLFQLIIVVFVVVQLLVWI